LLSEIARVGENYRKANTHATEVEQQAARAVYKTCREVLRQWLNSSRGARRPGGLWWPEENGGSGWRCENMAFPAGMLYVT